MLLYVSFDSKINSFDDISHLLMHVLTSFIRQVKIYD